MDYRNGQAIPGTQYRFTRELGAGGHGTVYAVEHTFLEAPAVMKLLHAELVDRDDLAQRMTREARTLAKLRHPNIVEVKDGGITAESPPRPYFVMEALNGLPLRDLLRQLRGPTGIGIMPAIRIMIGVLEGLEHAHRAGVVHRDIKPDNIFLHRAATDVTVPKILDFGIAHLLMAQRTTGRYFLGTPRYAAPEQLRGDAPTPRTDIYSAGLVLYEMLAGEVPYAELTEIGDIMQAHLDKALPSVQVRSPEVPLFLANFVAAMVEKDPENRLPTAFAGAVALREIRSRIEAKQAGMINNSSFRTEPAPMDSLMFAADRDAAGLAVTRVPAPAGAPSAKFDPHAKTRTDMASPSAGPIVYDTVVESRPAGAQGTAAPATPALRTTVRHAPRVVGGGVQHAMAHAATELDVPSPLAGVGARVDRNADTNTAAPIVPRSRPNFDTERLIDGLVDPQDVGPLPMAAQQIVVAPAIPAEHTTGQIAMSRNASGVGPAVSPPSAFGRQVTAFLVTLGVCTVIAVPVFWKIRQAYAPAAAAASPPPSAPATTPFVTTAAPPTPVPTTSENVTSMPAPVATETAAAPATAAASASAPSAPAAAAPKPAATAKPKKRVVDPNDPSTVPFE